MKSQFELFYIDIVGTCNLRCPSCPVSNYKISSVAAEQRSVGFMDITFFKKILDKIESERIDSRPVIIAVYNWGEPSLHPQFSSFIEAIKQKGFSAYVSTNMNMKDDRLKEIVASNPEKLIVSTSGYDHDIYSQTHTRGDPRLVVSNMFKLRYYMDLLKKNFDVEISYHLYKHNIHKDIERMALITKDLGFHLALDTTVFMPLENNFKYFDGVELSQNDRDIISLMLIKPEEYLKLAQPYKHTGCSLLDYTTINFDGSTALCCAVYDYENNIATNFLDVDRKTLDERKSKHPLCTKCMAMGLHQVVTVMGTPEMELLVNERLAALGSNIRKDASAVRRGFDDSDRE